MRALALCALAVVGAQAARSVDLPPPRPLADGCSRVYLDVGTNLGVQLRKLYEPHRYPRAPVLSIFDKHLGAAEDRVRDPHLCAFGFEPGPALAPRLNALQAAYWRRGWRVHIFTCTAVRPEDGEIDFYTYPLHNSSGRHVSSSFMPREDKFVAAQAYEKVRIGQLDLAKFIKWHVLARRLPAGDTGRPAVVMKLDVEGMELTVLPRLIEEDVLCPMRALFIEFHIRLFRRNNRSDTLQYKRMRAKALKQIATDHETGRCTAVLFPFDDETYGFDDGVFRSRHVQRAIKLSPLPEPAYPRGSPRAVPGVLALPN